MAFYDLQKGERALLVSEMLVEMSNEISNNSLNNTLKFCGHEDTYIRKSAYLNLGRIYLKEKKLQALILKLLTGFFEHPDFKVRQTTVNAAGEIGKTDFAIVKTFFDRGLFDSHHSVRNAVIGSVKKMGEKNPVPLLAWAQTYLHHPNKEIRREICHGIELRGRTHPDDILPLLKELQFDETARVRNTLVHVLGQIAYKKGCLEAVISDLANWENKKLVTDAVEEIIDVHERYRNFSFYTQEAAIQLINEKLYI